MKIICIGRNYVEHAKELQNEVPSEPFFFMKPDTAILRNGSPFYLPDFSNEIHHEAEIVLKIDKVGKAILPEFAHRYYSQITLGIDFTARDIQAQLKEKKYPWEISKAFDNSAFIGDFLPKKDFDLTQLNFHLERNNNKVQIGNTKDMIFNFDTIIADISKYFTLKSGDLIFTGTPAGVGQVFEKDILKGYIEKNKVFQLSIY